MKKLQVVLLVITTIIFLFDCTPPKKSPENKILKIGVILPLTGNAAIYGQSMKNGIELAYAESPIKDSIQLLYQDDKGDKTQSINAVQYLFTKNVGAIIGGSQSKTAEQIIPEITRHKIPLISPGASSVDFDSISPYFFRLWASDSYDGQIMANYIAKHLGLRNIAVFYTNSSYGVGIQKVFEKYAKDEDAKIIFSEPFDEGKTDFRTQLYKIKQTNAQGLFIPGYYAEVSVILKQIKELNIKMKIFGTSSFHDEKLLQTLGSTLNGVIFSYPAFDINDSNLATKNFAQNYNQKFNANADVFAANAYDCFKVIETTISKGANSPEKIKNMLLDIKKFPGAGGTFSFDNNGNVIKAFSILTVKNGEFNELK